MFQIDDPTAAAQPPAPGTAGAEGFFTGGDPVQKVPATRIRAWWLNMVQGELAAILAAANVVRDKLNNSQVLQALRVLFIDQPTFQAEVTAREAADTAEAQARVNADNALQTAINNEGTARVAADNNLYQELLTEEQARNTGDQNLYTGLTNEVNAREAADNLRPEFTEFAFRGTAPGSQRLANGMILQWATGQTSSGNQDAVAFLEQFPNAFLGAIVTEGAAGGWEVNSTTSPTIYGYTPGDAAHFFISAVRWNGSSFAFAGNVTYSYLAWGC